MKTWTFENSLNLFLVQNKSSQVSLYLLHSEQNSLIFVQFFNRGVICSGQIWKLSKLLV